MKSRKQKSHPTTEAMLDYLDGRLEAEAMGRIEDHVAAPCAVCQDALREIGALVQQMRSDRLADVPASLHRIALGAYAASTPRPGRIKLRTLVARLLFDSRSQPLPLAVRRSVGTTRRLSFALGDDTIEVECESESPGVFALRGRCTIADASGVWVELDVGSEHVFAWTDASGHFLFPRVPPGTARLEVEGAGQRWQLPAIEIEP